jgi:uncharacterized protein YxjI
MADHSSLLAHPTLVVEQKTKLFELRNEYRLFDHTGAQVGSVRQIRQGLIALVARIGTDWDIALPVRLEVRDASAGVVLELYKPWLRLAVDVTDSSGVSMGSIRKKVRIGKARFVLLDASGDEVGEVRAQNWRAKDFTIRDGHGQVIAQVTKKWRGLAREMFTDADTYVVELQPQALDPVRSLALGAALAVDLLMKQKDYD